MRPRRECRAVMLFGTWGGVPDISATVYFNILAPDAGEKTNSPRMTSKSILQELVHEGQNLIRTKAKSWSMF